MENAEAVVIQRRVRGIAGRQFVADLRMWNMIQNDKATRIQVRNITEFKKKNRD